MAKAGEVTPIVGTRAQPKAYIGMPVAPDKFGGRLSVYKYLFQQHKYPRT